LIARVTGPQEERARLKGLACEWRVELPDDVWLKGDALRIGQVLMNLLGNAVKFTEHGRIELLATWREGWLRVDVSDTGPEIPDAESAAIFQPFVQAGPEGARSQGTGLGLAISRELAELMGGTLAVSSNGESGSLFRLELPAPLATPPLRETGSGAPMPAPRRVLIVDDNDINRLLGRKLLERDGHSVEVACDGQEALAMIERQTPDVVLMDILMAGLDGLETTRELRRRGFTVPVIALTANVVQGDRERCIAAGMDGYLSKPLDIDALREAFRETGVTADS
jgi:CheY-like chemotaxis protein